MDAPPQELPSRRASPASRYPPRLPTANVALLTLHTNAPELRREPLPSRCLALLLGAVVTVPGLSPFFLASICNGSVNPSRSDVPQSQELWFNTIKGLMMLVDSNLPAHHSKVSTREMRVGKKKIRFIQQPVLRR